MSNEIASASNKTSKLWRTSVLIRRVRASTNLKPIQIIKATLWKCNRKIGLRLFLELHPLTDQLFIRTRHTSHLIGAKFASPEELIISGELQSCRGTHCSHRRQSQTSPVRVSCGTVLDRRPTATFSQLTESNTEKGDIRNCVSRAPNEKSQCSDMAWACSADPSSLAFGLVV